METISRAGVRCRPCSVAPRRTCWLRGGGPARATSRSPSAAVEAQAAAAEQSCIHSRRLAAHRGRAPPAPLQRTVAKLENFLQRSAAENQAMVCAHRKHSEEAQNTPWPAACPCTPANQARSRGSVTWRGGPPSRQNICRRATAARGPHVSHVIRAATCPPSSSSCCGSASPNFPKSRPSPCRRSFCAEHPDVCWNREHAPPPLVRGRPQP